MPFETSITRIDFDEAGVPEPIANSAHHHGAPARIEHGRGYRQWALISQAALLLLVAPSVHAAGFWTMDRGPSSFARGGANVADPKDPLAVYLNPAGLAGLDGLQLAMLGFCCANTLAAYGSFGEALYHWDLSRVSAVLATAPLFTIAR